MFARVITERIGWPSFTPRLHLTIDSSYGMWSGESDLYGVGKTFEQYLSEITFYELFWQLRGRYGNDLMVWDREASINLLLHEIVLKNDPNISRTTIATVYEQVLNMRPQTLDEFLVETDRIENLVESISPDVRKLVLKKPDPNAVAFWQELWPPIVAAVRLKVAEKKALDKERVENAVEMIPADAKSTKVRRAQA